MDLDKNESTYNKVSSKHPPAHEGLTTINTRKTHALPRGNALNLASKAFFEFTVVLFFNVYMTVIFVV